MASKLVPLTLGLGTVGLMWYLLGLHGWLLPLPAFIVVLVLGGVLFPQLQFTLPASLTALEKILILILGLQLALNALGLLVPEVSFDAVWYHLPEAQTYAVSGRITKIPGLLYSTMPRLGEVLLSAGFWLPLREGPKVVSFCFYLLFLWVVYRLSREFLTRKSALIITVAVNSFYVVSWQATAGYVDILRALFELASLYCLIHYAKKFQTTWLLPAGLLTGFALSVKMQSLIGLIAGVGFIAAALSQSKQTLKTQLLAYCLFLLPALIVAVPWYVDNYLQSGSPLYPLTDPALQHNLYSHSGTTGLSHLFSSQLLSLPLIPVRLALAPESQLSPLLLILFPFVLLQFKPLVSRSLPFVTYVISFLILWWFLPPPETRYALAGVVCLLLLEYSALFKYKCAAHIRFAALFFIFLGVLINGGIRGVVTVTNLPVILGRQSAATYIESHTTDFNRDKMQQYYSGYWLKLVNSTPVQ